MSAIPTTGAAEANEPAVLIRRVRPAEYDAVAELLTRTYDQFVPAPYLETLRDVRSRDEDDGVDVLVAVDRNRGGLCGSTTFVQPGSDLLDVARPGEAGMRMLAVDPGARKHGIGGALIVECAARARYAGAHALTFGTMDAMTDAARLYGRLGFARAVDRDLRLPSGHALRGYEMAVRPGPLVRRATPEEFAAVGELTVSAYVGDGHLPADDGYVAELRDAGRRASEADLLVAVDRTTGDLLGTLTYCSPGSPYAEIARPEEAEFRMLAVAPSARRRGAAEALVRRVLRRARSEGKRAVALSSTTGMTGAHRLYRRLGFRPTGRDWEPEPGLTLLVFSREV